MIYSGWYSPESQIFKGRVMALRQCIFTRRDFVEIRKFNAVRSRLDGPRIYLQFVFIPQDITRTFDKLEFVDFLLSRLEDKSLVNEIAIVASKSESFSFLNEDEVVYEKSDLKENYK